VAHDPAGLPGPTGFAGGLQVSLSHSRGLAAAAVTAIGPVGVDLEPVRPVEALVLARRWFPAREAAWLARVPSGQRDAAFLALWTQKEAIAKALGTGLRGGAGLRQPVPLGLPLVGQSGIRPADGGGLGLRGGPGLRLAAVAGRPGLAVMAASMPDGVPLAGGVVLAVACLGPGADGAAVTVRLPARPPPVR
jgi:4'-phosphopantetheinyl transferase